MDFIDGKYKLSDEDKRVVFYLFNAEESCNFTTKEYCYTEFWDINEKFCQVCYNEIAEEIKTYSDEHQNRLMQSLAKKQKDAFKDRVFHTYFRHKYCNHKYCSECNEKIVLKEDYVLVNPNNKQHLFSNVKQNYLVCSCNDFIYLPVVEKDVFLEQSQTSENNTERYILSLDRIKKGYSLLENPQYHHANTKIIRVNKTDIQNRIWFLSDHIPMKCKEKHPKLGKFVCDKIGNMVRGYYEIWVELNRSCRILDGLLPKIFSFRFMNDPLTQNVVSNIEAIYNENPMFWADYTKRIYKDIVIGICNLIDKDTEHNTISFFFFVNDEDLKKTVIGKKIANLLKTLYNNNLNDYSRLIKLRNKLFAHIDLDYLPTQNADELFLELQNLLIDIPLIKKFLEILSQIFESINKHYELRIDFKLNEITTTMHSDLLIGDINNILRKLDIYPVQKYTAHQRIEFDITKETIEKCHKEKKELDTVRNIVKNHAICHKGEIHFIDDKNEIGLDNDQLEGLIHKYVKVWLQTDDSVIPHFLDINDPLVETLNNNPIIKDNLNAHDVSFQYSDRDIYSNKDTGIIVESRAEAKPHYKITDELIQWIEDFNADKKVNPITCFVEHSGVDNFTGRTEPNGTIGIVE